MELLIDATNIVGLSNQDKLRLQTLFKYYNTHINKNVTKNKYYEGDIFLQEVNIGIALPKNFNGLQVGCSWGAKTVDVLASRSMFNGFVGVNGEDVDELDKIVEDNNLIAEYMKACRDELKYGCTFATLSADPNIGVKIRFHSPQTAAALWNGEKGRIDCGFAVIDSVPDNDDLNWIPSLIYYYTDDSIFVIQRIDQSNWTATRYTHKMGRPLMEPLIWNATSDKPFGQSRINRNIREYINQYIRIMADAAMGLEFSTTPQKYLLGITDEQYAGSIGKGFQTYVGNIFAATSNPETGEKPTFGQLTQGSVTPHVESLRMLATQFSAATGLSVTDTGVVNDANPTSSDAILAQSQTLVGMAEQLNVGNGNALKTIALMAQAIVSNVSLDELTDAQKDVVAHFKNPAMPTVAMTADAAIKIASVRPGFAGTDVFAEMIGFDKADIRRIKAQERLQQGMQVLTELGEV